MSTILRIGTRDSQLAVWQATWVQGLLKQAGVPSELVYIKSEGDIDTVTPLYALGVTGVFTKALDAALCRGRQHPIQFNRIFWTQINPLQSGRREDGTMPVTFLQLSQTGIHIAPQVFNFMIGIAVQPLRYPAHTACGNGPPIPLAAGTRREAFAPLQNFA